MTKQNPLRHYTLRLPTEALSELEKISKDKGTKPRTLIREWFLQGLANHNAA